jgi:KDO2-lipid IV(A) lauroyltransferase
MNPPTSTAGSPVRNAWWVRMVAAVPLPLLHGFAGLLAWLAFRVFPHRPEVILGNLAIAFPELDEAARRAIMRDFYASHADVLVEIVKSASMSADELRERVVVHGLGHVHERLAAGRPVLLIAAHQCNWEWMLLALSLQLGYPLDAAYKPLVDPWAEREMKIAAHALRRPAGAGAGAVRGHAAAPQDRAVPSRWSPTRSR